MNYICGNFQTMDQGLTLIATYTYPHEAVFIQSALESAGIRFFIRYHAPVIENRFYAHCERVKNIYVEDKDQKKAREIMQVVSPDFHMKNRCTLLHTEKPKSDAEPEPSEKRFCISCYAIMFSALGFAMYAIFSSIQWLF